MATKRQPANKATTSIFVVVTIRMRAYFAGIYQEKNNSLSSRGLNVIPHTPTLNSDNITDDLLKFNVRILNAVKQIKFPIAPVLVVTREFIALRSAADISISLAQSLYGKPYQSIHPLSMPTPPPEIQSVHVGMKKKFIRVRGTSDYVFTAMLNWLWPRSTHLLVAWKTILPETGLFINLSSQQPQHPWLSLIPEIREARQPYAISASLARGNQMPHTQTVPPLHSQTESTPIIQRTVGLVARQNRLHRQRSLKVHANELLQKPQQRAVCSLDAQANV